MPCYQVNLISVEFHAENMDLLRKAAAARGLNFHYDGQNINVGNMKIDPRSNTITGSSQSQINALKREYSRQTITQAARQNRWTVSQKAENVYQAAKY